VIGYLREIAALLRGSGRALAAAFGLSALSAVADMLCMVLLPVFLFATLAGPEALAHRLPLGEVVLRALPSYEALLVLVVAAFFLRGAILLYVGARLTRLGEAIRASLIGRLTHHYLTCPYQEYAGRSVAHAMTMVGAYAGTFTASVALPLMRLLLELMTVAAILSFLVFVDHRVVGFVSLALGAAATAYYLTVRGASERHSRLLSEHQAAFGQHLHRSLHSPREVRVFQLHGHFLAGMQDLLARSAHAASRLTVIAAMPRVIGELTLIGLALAYLVYRSRGGVDATLMLSQLGLLAFAGLRLLPAFALSMGHLSALKAGRHVTGLLHRELALTGAAPPATPAGAEAAREPFRSIELRDVSFAYGSDGRPALEHVTLRIEAGQSIGVVGPSGAGKSTLGDLLLGLLQPTSGTILVNDRPARLDTESWWDIVGFVPQHVFLSNDTLLRNIAFGVPDDRIDRARAARAASMAQLDALVASSPRGLDQPVGDYGVRLSGGQRQRVAIARALYRERRFLVLDEATSALDTETERAVVEAVDSLHGAVTMLIIAHRHTTLEGCDRVLEIREGMLRDLAPGPDVARAPAPATRRQE
jgi:ATP-binding cassette, subfamily B, bacterial PglK